MVYPYSNASSYPSDAYSAYRAQIGREASGRSSPRKPLATAVLLLGLATYVIGYAAVWRPDGSGWGVRFAVLAAVVAALGLLPRQSPHAKAMVALAVPAFLEALARSIIGDHRWAATTIVVLTALQALASGAGLRTELGAPGMAARGPVSYDPYAYYAQAAQQYYAANTAPPHQHPVATSARAQADAAALAQAEQSEAERYALYAEYVSVPHPGSEPVASARAGRAAPAAQAAAGSGGGPVQDIRSSNDAVPGSATQFPPV